MKQMSCDILIVGSGLTGMVVAYSLSLLGYKIILAEQKKISNNKITITPDTRTTAIAEGSKIFLDHIGLWKKLSLFVEPIKNINVIDRSEKNKIESFNSSLACDPISAFGGVVGINSIITEKLAI